MVLEDKEFNETASYDKESVTRHDYDSDSRVATRDATPLSGNGSLRADAIAATSKVSLEAPARPTAAPPGAPTRDVYGLPAAPPAQLPAQPRGASEAEAEAASYGFVNGRRSSIDPTALPQPAERMLQQLGREKPARPAHSKLGGGAGAHHEAAATHQHAPRRGNAQSARRPGGGEVPLPRLPPVLDPSSSPMFNEPTRRTYPPPSLSAARLDAELMRPPLHNSGSRAAAQFDGVTVGERYSLVQSRDSPVTPRVPTPPPTPPSLAALEARQRQLTGASAAPRKGGRWRGDSAGGDLPAAPRLPPLALPAAGTLATPADRMRTPSLGALCGHSLPAEDVTRFGRDAGDFRDGFVGLHELLNVASVAPLHQPARTQRELDDAG